MPKFKVTFYGVPMPNCPPFKYETVFTPDEDEPQTDRQIADKIRKAIASSKNDELLMRIGDSFVIRAETVGAFNVELLAEDDQETLEKQWEEESDNLSGDDLYHLSADDDEEISVEEAEELAKKFKPVLPIRRGREND